MLQDPLNVSLVGQGFVGSQLRCRLTATDPPTVLDADVEPLDATRMRCTAPAVSGIDPSAGLELVVQARTALLRAIASKRHSPPSRGAPSPSGPTPHASNRPPAA